MALTGVIDRLDGWFCSCRRRNRWSSSWVASLLKLGLPHFPLQKFSTTLSLLSQNGVTYTLYFETFGVTMELFACRCGEVDPRIEAIGHRYSTIVVVQCQHCGYLEVAPGGYGEDWADQAIARWNELNAPKP